MESEEEDSIDEAPKRVEEEPRPRRRPKKVVFPRRVPSVVIPPRKIFYPTADKTTCLECTCYPKEEPYTKPKKLKPCQQTPLTLYELAAAVVDQLPYPEAYKWTEEEVAQWMEDVVGLPQYKTCITDNHINGRRLLFLEDPSHMPMINIHYKDHIFRISDKVRELFNTDYIRFARSVGLPPRKPLTHCTWFKSRTGPSWGVRQNWDRSDILRWMKILAPKPIYLDHWDLVWYWPPDFPISRFAKIPLPSTHEHIPHYKYRKPPPCREYLALRKFRLQRGIDDKDQMIWMEHRPGSPVVQETELVRRKREARRRIKTPTIPKPSRLDPPKIDTTGLVGKDLILARRLMPRKKFLDFSR